MEHFSKYTKIGIYSSGIALAIFGYIFNRHKQETLSKNKILYQIYYPLLLQYPATLDLYFSLVSKNKKDTSHKLSIACSLISSIIIPLFHSRIYFKNPDKYSTRRLITQLFKPSNQSILNTMQFYTFFSLTIPQIYSYYISKKASNTTKIQWSLEKLLFYYISPVVLGSIIFEKMVRKSKEILAISEYNPALLFNEYSPRVTAKRNYAMYVLFDIDESVLTPEIASICMEYAMGYSLMNMNEANILLANVIYDHYNGVITQRSYRNDPRYDDNNTPKKLYEMLDKEDTRFVDKLCDVMYKYKFEGNDENVKRELAELWIKNNMSPLYDTSITYGFVLCMTTPSWSWLDLKVIIDNAVSFVFDKV